MAEQEKPSVDLGRLSIDPPAEPPDSSFSAPSNLPLPLDNTNEKPRNVSLLPLEETPWNWSREFAKGKLGPYEAQIVDKTVVFHPFYSYGTAAILGELALTQQTVAFWELEINFVCGTSMMFGIGTTAANLLSPISFENLLGGEDRQSYGLSHRGRVYYGGNNRTYCAALSPRSTATVGVLFDGPKRQLTFFVNGKNMGIAFDGLDVSQPLYPMVSSTSQKSYFTVFNQRRSIEVGSLRVLSLERVATLVRDNSDNNRPDLGLPTPLADRLESRIVQLRTFFTPAPLRKPGGSPRKRRHEDEGEEGNEEKEEEPNCSAKVSTQFLTHDFPLIASKYRELSAWGRFMDSRKL